MKLKKIIQYSLSVLLAAVFMYFAFRGVKLSDLLDSLQHANYWWVVVLVPVVVLSHWVRALRWKYLMAPVKENCSLSNLFAGVMIGYAVNNVLPRVGELVRPYVIGKTEHVSKSAALATVVVERILDLMSFYFIACVALFLYPHALDAFFTDATSIRPLFLAGSLAGLAVFLVLFFKAESVFRFLAKAKTIAPDRFASKIDTILDSFYEGLSVVKRRDKFAVILLLSFSIQALYVLCMYIPFMAFSALVRPELDFGAAFVLLVISSIAWILPAPGAMGTYHSFLTVAMVKLYGVDMTTALSYSILTHEVGYIIVMVIGLYYYFKDQIKMSDFDSKNKNEEQSI